MSYTVLARKWRPKNFSELVGQSHVMQALSNALDQQRLHHAYLFTGTRGVGKTTIARIFAKALNCQEGITSQPCGVCETCKSIDEGRFIDLIEVDAASKTKVDDTREILDNVQFAPTQGRYKVYLIDEVHMLSKSSFNALLKTLEEPPEHVKFLLATTDPHKLPITVLSRCLQFNLMRLTQPQIQNHLAHILAQENVPFEDAALALIAKSADGSARDSLSLLDQAIAYGAGEVMFEAVQTMLGLVDQQFGVAILQALANDDAQQVKTVIQQLATMGVDYQALLAQLIESLHAISYVQLFADNETTTLLPADIVQGFAASFAPEKVQLLYQIALLTKQDMQLAPDIRIGFEMALMRMLAFQPAQTQHVVEANSSTSNAPKASQAAQVANSENADVSPVDALSSLATARSLVGKKNTSITPSTSSEKDLAQARATEKPLTAPTEPNQAINQDTYSNENIQTDMVASQPDISSVVNSTVVKEEPPVPGYSENYMQEHQNVIQQDNERDTPSVTNAPVAETAQRANVPSGATDHLAQIRERLKQPFAKQATPITQSPDATLSETTERVEKPVNHFETANDSIVESTQSNFGLDSLQANDYASGQSAIEQEAAIPNEQSVAPVLNDSPSWDMNESHGVDELIQPPVQDNAHQSDVPVQSPVVEPSLAVEKNLSNVETFDFSGDDIQDWINVIRKLGLKGMAEDMARNSVLVELNDAKLTISIDPEQQYAKPEMVLQQIEAAAKQCFGNEFIFEVVQAVEHFTPVKYEQQLASEKQSAAQQSIAQDGVVNSLISTLGMEVIQGSIKPV